MHWKSVVLSFREFIALVLLGLSGYGRASNELSVYEPGRPAPAIGDAAEVFGKEQGIEVRRTAGPTTRWASDLLRDGDVVYSGGSEAMMSDFISQFADTLMPETLRLLYLRPAGILVRPGNPLHIQGFRDLLRPQSQHYGGERRGPGRAVGRHCRARWRHRGATRLPRKCQPLREHSAEAVQAWKSDPSIQAWISFPIWSSPIRVYPRSCRWRRGIAYTSIVT